jgi:hypothetical protein
VVSRSVNSESESRGKVSHVPRRCTVCDHPERHSFNEALVSGTPYRSVAKRFELSAI